MAKFKVRKPGLLGNKHGETSKKKVYWELQVKRACRLTLLYNLKILLHKTVGGSRYIE